MARPSDGAEAAGTWEEVLYEAVIKHERGVERQLYVYGISVNRCPQCRARIKASSKQCEACEFTLNVQRACRRCTDKAIEMWCFECDAYFCVRCYSRSHVLSTSGSRAPHKCFPIEGGSGKSFAKGSWNDELAALTQRTYRMRVSERLAAPPVPRAVAPTVEASASPVEMQREAVDSQLTLEDRAAPSETTAQPSSFNAGANTALDERNADGTVFETSANSAGVHAQDGSVSASVHTTPGSASASSSASPPDDAGAFASVTATGSESRKRPLVGEAGGVQSDAKHQRTTEQVDSPAHQQGTPTTTRSPPTSAKLSLYEQVRLMHEKRQQKTAVLPPRPHSAHQKQQQQLEQQEQQATQTPVTHQTPHSEQESDTRSVAARPSAPERPTPPAIRTTPEVAESPSLPAPLSSPLAAEQQQQVMDELKQPDRLLQRAASDSSLASASTQPPTQGTNASQPLNQAAYPVQTVQSPLHSPFLSPLQSPFASSHPSQAPSPSVPASHQQLFGGYRTPLSTEPLHDESTVAVGFLRPSAVAAHSFQPSTTATIDLTGPVVSVRGQQAIGFQSATPVAGDLPDEDALLSAVLADFNSINAHVMEIESKIQSMMGAVRMFSFQDVTKAATLNAKIAEHRHVLDKARARRTQISARVMMYLPAVSEFARSADRGSWGDVPRVLTSCQSRLAQLAGEMTSCEQRVQQLRGLIDDAVSSNDALRIMQVQELGDQLKQEEVRLDALKGERDGQFVLMIKFSRELREAVQLEVAALSRNAPAPASSS